MVNYGYNWPVSLFLINFCKFYQLSDCGQSPKLSRKWTGLCSICHRWCHKAYVAISGALFENWSELAMLYQVRRNWSYLAITGHIASLWTISGHFRAYLALWSQYDQTWPKVPKLLKKGNTGTNIVLIYHISTL